MKQVASRSLPAVAALAWAVGNVAELRRMTHVDQASACIAAVMNTSPKNT